METPTAPKFQVLENALIEAGIAQSDRKFLGGKVAFTRSPRLDVETLFVALEHGKHPSGKAYGETVENLLNRWPAFADIRDEVISAVEIARRLGWSEHNHFYRNSK